MPDMSHLLLLPYLLFCFVIFLYDYLFRRVPNNLLLIAMAVQLGCLVIFGSGLNGVSWTIALSGFGLGLGFFLPLYALRAMAAGDVKFFALLGLLLGASALVPVFLIGSAIAGVHAVAIGLWRLGLAPSLQVMTLRVARWTLYQRILEKRGNRIGIPYAAYLALGGAWAGLHNAGVIPGFS